MRLFKFLIILILTGSLVFMLVLKVSPLKSQAWQSTPAKPMQGVLAPNNKLARLSFYDLLGEHGPEQVTANAKGDVYFGVASGWILRKSSGADKVERWHNTGGRPLGMAFDSQGNLLVADAYLGLLSINPAGVQELLSRQVSDQQGRQGEVLYADGVVIAPDGLVYFTDASNRYGAREIGDTMKASTLDILEHQTSSRVLVFNPVSGRTDVVASGFSFANGILVSADAASLLVAETGAYRVWSLPIDVRNTSLSALQKNGQAKIIIDDLPGFPDNLGRDRQGRIWLGLTRPRSALIDATAGYPVIRNFFGGLPSKWWPVPKSYGHVLAIDEQGHIFQSLQDAKAAYADPVGASEIDGRLYIHSLQASHLGWLPLDELDPDYAP